MRYHNLTIKNQSLLKFSMKSTKQKKNTKTKVIINDFECPKNLLSPKIRTLT